MTEEIKQYLNYDPETGTLTWKKQRKKINVGDVAGSLNKEGYIAVVFNYKRYKAHRLAWFLYYGTSPENIIDHINGNRSDNRIMNLRESTTRKNGNNLDVHRKGKLVGTSFQKNSGRYRAAIEIDKKYKHLGYYDTELEAHHAYLSARKTHCGY